eukprot:5513059-Amphidinium_carterae.1
MFQVEFQQAAESKKQMDMVEKCVKHIVHIMLLEEFGDIDGGISWSKLNKVLVDAIKAKAKLVG